MAIKLKPKARKPRYRVGQVVKLVSEIAVGGYRVQPGIYGVIDERGTNAAGYATFLLPFGGPLHFWVSGEEIRPLTKRERGEQGPRGASGRKKGA